MENVSDNITLKALGQFAVERLAATFDDWHVSSRCEKVSLNNVTAEIYVLPNRNKTIFERNLYDVTFTVAAPALGKFGILILREEKTGRYKMAGNFNRLDKYGKNGDCMDRGSLRKLCTCKK